ncbi:hypothetical protein LXA43DRAFT_1066711 [Ganoderma leucocontextum]|nr:hypothetical protein LXA43DRAFT_1066711 [Ganoderma leucocontextum]
MLTGGNVDVVGIPTDVNTSPLDQSKGEEIKEQIVGVAMWIPPGVTLDFKLPMVLRAGAHKVAFAWGFKGSLKPTHTISRGDTLREPVRGSHPKPVHLCASKPKNKDIYEHLAFELVETLTVGAGEVDANGLNALRRGSPESSS